MEVLQEKDRPTISELRSIAGSRKELERLGADRLTPEELTRLRRTLRVPMEAHDPKGLPNALMTLETARLFAESIEPDRNILLAILLFPLHSRGEITRDAILRDWGEDVATLIERLEKVSRFSNVATSVDQDNFRGLMLSLAEDIRVIMIMIVSNLVLMRAINLHPDDTWVRAVAFEANCLYAQLAHRLGLYGIKSELEDLSLKYTNREIYKQIARKLAETKRERDAYIESFIGPVKKKIEEAGIKFHIKGRTKSISSIWAKMRKQKVDLDRIYDLFAIRVIIDSEPEKEKSDCWTAYSILTDMYTPNPSRMRDWISIPKSNGYESLHATVMGPGNRWVEVQFRTVRMDLVAEKGLAAHWRYKGGRGDWADQWMNNVRDILETADSGPMQLMRDLRMDIYGREVFAFTPKGDLYRLPAGATVLDFAFRIHSNVGCHCTGANINGAYRKINYKIESGDTVEIITSPTQTPRPDWLNLVVSAKSRNKIKQKLNEDLQHRADLGKELFERRARNRKIEIDEPVLMKMILKSGYKYINEFFADIADEKLDPGKVLAQYADSLRSETEKENVSAEEFRLRQPDDEKRQDDVLLIGEKSIRGLNYRLARCCNPIYGDPVFGFISSDGMVKVHREDCPNAAHIKGRYPYRLIRVDWSGKSGGELPATLSIIGTDDIGIVASITSIISKEPSTTLRNISVSSSNGLFHGCLTVGVPGPEALAALVRKIRTVRGVKEVTRV